MNKKHKQIFMTLKKDTSGEYVGRNNLFCIEPSGKNYKDPRTALLSSPERNIRHMLGVSIVPCG